jgi:hypothetical protein
LRRGAVEHVLHRDESLKGVAIPRVEQKSIPWNRLLGSGLGNKVCNTVFDKYVFFIADPVKTDIGCQILNRIGHISNN